MEQIEIANAFYIKLGSKGIYVPHSIPAGKARIGYDYFTLEEINGKEWDVLKKKSGPNYDKKGVATRDINMLRFFVESTPEDVWITFHNRRLYWCRLENSPVQEDNVSRFRPVLGGWSEFNLVGRELFDNQIPGNISKKQAYRAAICRVEEVEQLRRLIGGEPSDVYQAIALAKENIAREVERGVRLLHWKDFEILVDLLFRNAGWNRISMVGETMNYVDIVLEEPITGERYLVQVKSTATGKDFEEFISKSSGGGYTKLYFIVHSPAGDFANKPENVEVMLPNELARKVVDLGLTDWLMKKIF